jgi:hypothetical protein
MSKFTVIKDTRERDGWFFLTTDHIDGQVDRKLDTGDYSIVGLEELLCIERKRSVSELAENVGDKRFERELERMKYFKYKFLILEFNMDDIIGFPIGSSIPKSKWNKLRITDKFIMRYISEILVKYGVPTIFAGGKDNAKYIANNIMRRVHEYEFHS